MKHWKTAFSERQFLINICRKKSTFEFAESLEFKYACSDFTFTLLDSRLREDS